MKETSWRLEAKVNYSDSVTTETPPAFEVLRQDVGYATQFTAQSVGLATKPGLTPRRQRPLRWLVCFRLTMKDDVREEKSWS